MARYEDNEAHVVDSDSEDEAEDEEVREILRFLRGGDEDGVFLDANDDDDITDIDPEMFNMAMADLDNLFATAHLSEPPPLSPASSSESDSEEEEESSSNTDEGHEDSYDDEDGEEPYVFQAGLEVKTEGSEIPLGPWIVPSVEESIERWEEERSRIFNAAFRRERRGDRQQGGVLVANSPLAGDAGALALFQETTRHRRFVRRFNIHQSDYTFSLNNVNLDRYQDNPFEMLIRMKCYSQYGTPRLCHRRAHQ